MARMVKSISFYQKTVDCQFFYINHGEVLAKRFGKLSLPDFFPFGLLVFRFFDSRLYFFSCLVLDIWFCLSFLFVCLFVCLFKSATSFPKHSTTHLQTTVVTKTRAGQ